MNKALKTEFPEVVSVRLTASEKDKFDNLTEELGVTKSALLRRMIRRKLYSLNTKTEL